MASGIARVNGAEIAFEDVGAGPAVVLAHGFGCDMTMWDGQMGALTRAYRVVRYDAQAHGRSSVPSGPYAHHEDLVGLLDERGIDRAHLVGMSNGGRVVVDTALAHPERVRSLVTVDAVLSGYRLSADLFRGRDEILAATTRGDRKTASRVFMEGPLLTGTRGRPKVMDRIAAMYERFSFWPWWTNVPERPLDPPARGRLGNIECPTLVIVGDQDVPDCLAIADILAREIPHARLETLSGVGHFANMEAPEAVNALLLEFLRELRS